MPHAKVIECFGIDCYDFTFYLSRIFNNLNKRVIVVDFRNKLKYKWGNGEFEKLFTYRDIDFCINISQADLSCYDLVLIVHKSDECFNIFENSLRLIFTDQMLNNLKFTNTILETGKERLQPTNKTAIVIRNYINCSANYKYLRHYWGSDVELLPVSFDYNNLKCEIELWFDDVCKFNVISKDYKEALKRVIDLCLDERGNQIKNAFVLAERGK